jgi:hypothetical protein
MVEFIGLFDTARDYTLQLTTTEARQSSDSLTHTQPVALERTNSAQLNSANS